MISDDIDVLYWGTDEHDEEGNLIDEYQRSFEYADNLTGVETAKKKYLKDIWLCNCNEVYKLKIIKDNNIRYLDGVFAGEDANFIYRVLFNSKKVKVLPKNYFHQVVRSNSLFRDKFSEKHLTEFIAIENTLKYIEEHNIPDIYEYLYSDYYHTRVNVAKRLVRNLRWYQGFKFIKLNKKYNRKIKKRKPLHLNKRQKTETRIYNFSKLMFFCFVKVFDSLHKKK